MQKQTRELKPAMAIEIMRELLSSAIDYDQIIVLKAELGAERADFRMFKELTSIKEDAIKNSQYLLRARKILEELVVPSLEG